MADETTPVPGVPQPGGSGRWLRYALFVSLALNLLILGMIGGAMIGQRRDRGDDHRVAERALIPLGLGLYARALEPEDTRALLRAAVDRRDALVGARVEIRTGVAELARAVRAEPFDAAQAAQVMARQATVAAGQLDLGARLLIDRLSEMSPEARAGFADRLEATLRRLPPPRPPQP